jgi:hypothetical protein
MMYQPDQVHLVSSAHVEKKGLTARLERMLQDQGMTVVLHDDLPDSDIQLIREFAHWLAQSIDQEAPNANITLNVTGGNKLMALGMWEVFNGAVEVIYTDTFHQCIEHLHNNQKEPIESVLDVPTYLEAHGVRYIKALSDDDEWQDDVQSRKRLTNYIAKNAVSLGRLIGTLNYHVHNATEEIDRELVLTSPTQTMARRPNYLGCGAMDVLEKEGLLTWDGDKEFTFTDVESARYLGGIWLEEYTYLCAVEAGAEYIASSVKINWEKSRQTTNELDLILVHRNRMLVIECKTLRFGVNEQKDSDMVYKISDLGDELRGLFGKTWLVSARKPDHVLMARARSRQLSIIAEKELTELKRYITLWMEA